MADDGRSGIGGAISGVAEAIGKPIVNEAKEFIKEAVGQSTGSNLKTDPQEEAKKKAEDEKKKRNIQAFLSQMAADQERLRLQKKQEEEAKKQQEAQAEQAKKVKKTEELQDSKQRLNVDLQNKQRSTERKTGTG